MIGPLPEVGLEVTTLETSELLELTVSDLDIVELEADCRLKLEGKLELKFLVAEKLLVLKKLELETLLVIDPEDVPPIPVDKLAADVDDNVGPLLETSEFVELADASFDTVRIGTNGTLALGFPVSEELLAVEEIETLVVRETNNIPLTPVDDLDPDVDGGSGSLLETS